MKGLSVRLAIDVSKPKKITALLDAIEKLGSFAVRAKKAESIMVIEFPSFTFSFLEQHLDTARPGSVKVQLVEYDMGMYEKAVKTQPLSGQERLKLVTAVMKKQPKPLNTLSKTCEPGEPEYNYIKRIIRGFEQI